MRSMLRASVDYLVGIAVVLGAAAMAAVALEELHWRVMVR